jgi:hypothetical protein
VVENATSEVSSRSFLYLLTIGGRLCRVLFLLTASVSIAFADSGIVISATFIMIPLRNFNPGYLRLSGKLICISIR